MKELTFDFNYETGRFYNTNETSGEELIEKRFKINSQNRKVLEFFRLHPFENYTSFEAWKGLGIRNQPKSSIQRAMTDLTPEFLEKLDGKEGRPKVMRAGEYKEMCYARRWRLK